MIDQVIEKLGERNEEPTSYFEHLQDNEFWLSAFVSSEDTEILTTNEKMLFQYLVTVIFDSFKEAGLSDMEDPDLETLGGIEDAHWDLFGKQKGLFRDRLNVFFEATGEEDLLAFVEDMLIEEEGEESDLSEIGRNVIFVKVNALIDFLSGITTENS